jgi:hypothetical protein
MGLDRLGLRATPASSGESSQCRRSGIRTPQQPRRRASPGTGTQADMKWITYHVKQGVEALSASQSVLTATLLQPQPSERALQSSRARLSVPTDED